MRRLRIALVATVFAGLLAQAAPAQKKDKDKGGENADKVTICHFPGHDGDFQILGNEECEPDGKVLHIPRKAAVRGHGVELDDEDDDN